MFFDFCRRFEIIFYVNVIELKMSCYSLNFKYFRYENGFIVIILLKSKVICREKGKNLKRIRNIFREFVRGK